MPSRKNHSDSTDNPKKNGSYRSHSQKKCRINTDLKLVCFENSIASKAQDKDIIRACSLYNKTQEKIIKLKIAQIYFN